ncbi:MAG: transpeptidase family protein [Bacteroidales bacterium]|nr:transpeptidase family protein [Bacteroidales bacterium]
MDRRTGILLRVALFYSIMVLVAISCFLKIGYIQLFRKEMLMKYVVDRKEEMLVPEKAFRGDVLASDGSLLSTSVPKYDIYFDPVAVSDEIIGKELDAFADSLSRMLKKKTKAEYKDMVKKARADYNAGNTRGTRNIKIASKVSMDEYIRMRNFPIFRHGRNKGGFKYEQVYVRELPYGKLASRTIGFTRTNSKDSLIVAVGIEGAYNDYLKGSDGYQKKRRIYGNAWVAEDGDTVNVATVNGDDVYTSINIELQDVAETALEKCLIENNALQGCIIMMDVKSGLVEVMASLCYNEETGTYEERYNYAIANKMDPGSTFKAVTMLTLLENDPDFNIDRKIHLGKSATKYMYGKPIKDSHDVTDANGYTTIRNAFEQSSNIAFAMLVEEAFKNNQERFFELVYSTKINEPLNLDIVGEASPVVKNTSSKTWSKMTMPWMAFGYESLLVPIHILTFYNAIANDGVMVKPQFVKEIRNDDEVKFVYDTIVINERIASPKTISTLQELLRGVVVRGTARSKLGDLPFQVSGKTGTAQVAVGKSGYDKANHTASFVGYFPSDKPKYSCIVVVSHPRNGQYYGASVSAPVFRDVAQKVYATQLGVVEYDEEFDADCKEFFRPTMVRYDDFLDYSVDNNIPFMGGEGENGWVKVSESAGDIVVTPVELDENKVPDLKGMNITDAVYLLESMGWKVTFSGNGKVKSQSVKAGSVLRKGNTINLVLSAK